MRRNKGRDQGDLLVIRSVQDLVHAREEVLKRIIGALAIARTFAFDEMNKAFDYADEHTRERRLHEDVDEVQALHFFIATLSDVLHVKMDSILTTFEMCHIDIVMHHGQDVLDLPEDANDQAAVIDFENENVTEIPIKNCYIYTKKELFILVIDDGQGKQWHLKKGPAGFCFEVLTESQSQSIKKLQHQSFRAYLQAMLPDYQHASYLHQDHLYQHWSVSCYPIEISNKLEMHERFSENYLLPEKQAKFARPILELELVGMLGPCVRCYLTLAGRPRAGKPDKDITQNGKGDVIFNHVKLMNFSDPLRAFTWVEDYLKNSEHGVIEKHSPIIRSFLITLKEYNRALSEGEVLLVDADRAPGQVRFQGSENCPLKAVRHSLLSFMDREVTLGDGCVKSLNELSLYLFGEPLEAHLIAEEAKIAHQHGRPIEGSALRYRALNIETKAGQLLDARHLERDLAGFNLEPTSAIEASADFLLYGKAAKKQRHAPRAMRDKENNKENRPPKKNR